MGFAKTIRSIKEVGLAKYISLKTLPKGRRVPVRINGFGILVRARTTDLSVAMDSLTYEFDCLVGLLPQDFDGLIIDAGAYIGTASLRLMKIYPNATIVAVEPASENFELLKVNTGSYPSIKAEKYALSAEPGKVVNLYDPSEREWGYSISVLSNKETGRIIESVETTTVKSISQRYGKEIGVLKLDIEGEEASIFDHADDTLKLIPIVFVELHERSVPGCESSFNIFSKERVVIKTSGEKFLSILSNFQKVL